MTTRTENDREKAVAIAKDVIEQLRLERVVAACGFGYWGESFRQVVRDNPGDLQPHMDEVNRCEVCALGAMFLSQIRLYDKVTGYDVRLKQSCLLHERLIKEVFTELQHHLIEYSYEGWQDESPWCGESRRFYNRHPDDNERLQQICLNIIHNDGYFDPENHPEE